MLLASLLVTTPRIALADYGYLGTGKWTWTNLTYYTWTSGDYTTVVQNATYNWDLDTHLSVQSTMMDYEDIGLHQGNFGQTIWDGRTVICAVPSGTCYTSTPINENYNYVEITFNTYWLDSVTWQKKQAVASHELGHAFSLAHVPTCDPDHIMYTPVNATCNGGIIWEQQHDIDAVNARY